MYSPDDPYLNWRSPLPSLVLSRGNSAVLVTDMQYSDADVTEGVFKHKRALGLLAGLDYYAKAMQEILPNIRRLQDKCRASGIEVMYSRNQAATRDGRDRGQIHKNHAILCPPGSREAQILDEIAPASDELLFSKTTGSVFNSTAIHHVLFNMGIRNLVICGVMTSGCVESAVRDASDLGYGVIVVADACASWTEELHTASLRVMHGVFARVHTTMEVLAMLSKETL